MTKNFFRLMMLAALAGFIGVFVYALEIDKKNVGPVDLVLPTNTAGKARVQRVDGSVASPLEVQHMSDSELTMLLSDIVADSLSFTKSDFVYKTAEVEAYFTPTGYAQYKEFLQKAAFEQVLSSGKLQSAAYVEQEALEVSSGVFNGAYKWLYEVPVTISFIPPDAETYRDGAIKPENRRILLRAQFTRVADPQDPQAVKIEIWQVLPPRRF